MTLITVLLPPFGQQMVRVQHALANQIQAGIVMINCPFSAFPGTPFGGYKQSGFGRELSKETLKIFILKRRVLCRILEVAQ